MTERQQPIELTATSRERISVRLAYAARCGDLGTRALHVAEARVELDVLVADDARLELAVAEAEQEIARLVAMRGAP